MMSDELKDSIDHRRDDCRQFDMGLSAYLEGETRPEVLAHARECAFCSVVLADLELIRSASRDMPLEEPHARVWANIHATLESENVFRPASSAWPRWLGWHPQTSLQRFAAPFAALAGLTLVATVLMIHPRSANPGLPSLPISARNQSVLSNPPAPVSATNAALEQTVNDMEKTFQSREKYLDPAVQASYQKGLNSLDASIHECQASIQKEPSDSLAQEYLTTAYEQKAAVLSSALVDFEGR